MADGQTRETVELDAGVTPVMDIVNGRAATAERWGYLSAVAKTWERSYKELVSAKVTQIRDRYAGNGQKAPAADLIEAEAIASESVRSALADFRADLAEYYTMADERQTHEWIVNRDQAVLRELSKTNGFGSKVGA